MKLAIHQPYLFPYIGYFQLMAAVDQFIFADNMQYIKNGWINGNRILARDRERIISLPIKRDDRDLRINQRFFAEPVLQHKQEFLNKVENDYSKAPYFREVFPLLQVILSYEDRNVAAFVCNQLRVLAEYLGIRTPCFLASGVIPENGLHCQDWVIAAIKERGASHYINSIGGMGLYSKDVFARQGVQLSFLKTKDIKYKQFGNDFIPNLSIIDVMMFNSRAEIRDMLGKFELM